MSYFQITGGIPLEGICPIHGAKNSVLPILAACLLSAVFLFKKGVYDQAVDNHLMKREQERLVSQMQEMESSMEDLRRDHQKLEREMKNAN